MYVFPKLTPRSKSHYLYQTIDSMDSIDFPSSLLSLNAPIRGFLINTPITILRNMKAKPFPTLFEKQRVPSYHELRENRSRLQAKPSALILRKEVS